MNISLDLFGSDAKNRGSARLLELVAYVIIFASVWSIMHATIDFQLESDLVAAEVGDIAPNWTLSTNFNPRNCRFAQVLPEDCFRLRLLPAQRSRKSRLVLRLQLHDHLLLPSPLAGEGLG